MKRFIITIVGLFLTGCVQQVLPEQYKKAEEVCSTNGGLASVEFDYDYFKPVCKNSARFLIVKEDM